MHSISQKERHILEGMLILTCVGLTCLLYVMQGYKMVILNLFFLPVALGGFFLGRYRAGVLALFCVICASLATAARLGDLGAPASPLVIALAVTVWGAVLGLTAMLIGVLSDDRTAKVRELHEAYVGVVEVLSQYLQNGHPTLKVRSIQVAELSHRVAAALKLSSRQIDDIRVAALLYDVKDIEVTTKVIRRAVNKFEEESSSSQQATFQGADLMLSLGSVLSGAIPLLLNQHTHGLGPQAVDRKTQPADAPVGAEIIRMARAYLALADEAEDASGAAPAAIVQRLRGAWHAGHQKDLVDALAQVVVGQKLAPLPLVADVSLPAATARGSSSRN
jgi:hypothetical protein